MYKNTIHFIFVTIVLLLNLSCSEKSSNSKKIDFNKNIDLKQNLMALSRKIEFKNLVKLKSISTYNGYSSMIKYSDSLNNKTFIKRLKSNLTNCKINDLNWWNDSMFAISLGERNDILGATGGFLIIERTNGELRINDFRGGK